MKLLSKKIITTFILVSFLTIAFFSFGTMMHDQNGDMPGDCPFTAMGQSLCPSNALNMAMHHISTYYSLFNIPIVSGFSLIFILFFFISFVSSILINSSLLDPPISFQFLYDSPQLNSSYRSKITHWLSLLENSPSAI